MNRQRNTGAAQRGETRDLTIGSSLNGLTLPHLWGAIAAVIALVVGSFYFGVWSANFFANRKMIEELQFKNQFFETYLRYAISTGPQLRPADVPDAIIARDHERAMS